jgi:predicted RNase H-like HicB family nuclease
MPTWQDNGQEKAETNVADSSRYPIEVFYSEEDGGFIAIAKDLPGCSAFGKTQAKALAEIHDAIKAWQQAAKAAGNPVPEPSHHVEEPLPSGKILLRIPRSLHASLIECAKKESVSLNQHLVSVLSMSVATTLQAKVPLTVWAHVSSVHYVGSTTIRSFSLPSSSEQRWRSFGNVETVVPPGREELDVRTLPAGVPVIQVGALTWSK